MDAGLDRSDDWTGNVELTREEGRYVASLVESDITSQGETMEKALTNLSEAITLHDRGVPDDIESYEPEAP